MGDKSIENTQAGLPVERHHALDLVRGLAALCVAQYHFMKWQTGVNVQSLGTFTVYIFFILSALTMMLVYGRRFDGGIPREAAVDFYVKRAARLLPLLLSVTLVAFAFSMRAGDADPARSILTATGLMALHLPGMLSTVPGAWSLGIEIAFYLVFPVTALLIRSWKAAAWLFVLLVIGQQLLIHRIAGDPDFWSLYNTPLTYAPFFLLGVLIYRAPMPRLTPSVGTTLSLGCFATVAGFSFYASRNLFDGGWVYVGLMGLAAASIACAWATVLPASLTAIAKLLGEMSYPLYLTHWLALDIVAKLSRAMHLPAIGEWAVFAVVAFVGALAANRLVERPSARYFRQRKSTIASLP